ncbi:Lrp/AsnC ligand binding domain-containing protein [Cytophaga aurantiaca]|uniref:Lrp/AsnC ligand binding domain-containing protein n=1 Tax=Cytophaga aurantiaca TaxID=29530 RepID=UPI00036E0817|nr:Lrp/AsnC ligand binding domain-containing protein [Cytophaga aurantiaca]
MALHSEIDSIDLKILTELIQDASLPYTEIAKKIGVSGGTIHVRMKKMEDLGIVKGSHLEINYNRLGYDITAFLGIYLDKSEFYDKAVDDLRKIPEVVNVHYTTGNYSMFVKIICRDTQHLREVLHDKIQKVYGIQRTETSISLEESINRTLALDL